MIEKQPKQTIVRTVIPLSRYWTILSVYLSCQKAHFVSLAVLVIGGIGMQVVNPQIMRSFIDNALAGKPITVLLGTAVTFIVVALVQQAVSVLAGYTGENVAWRATNGLRADLAMHSLKLDMSFHNNKSPGELIERIEGDVSEFSNFFSQLVLRLAGNLLLLTGILIALFHENMAVGAVFTVFSIVTLLALNAVRGVAIPHQKALRDAETDLFAFLEERLAGTEDIRSCGGVGFVISRLFALQTAILRRWRTSAGKQFLVRVTAGFMLSVGYGCAMVMGFNLYKQHVLTLGTVYLIMYYTGLLARPIRELSQQVEGMQNIGASVERMSEVMNIRSAITDGTSEREPAKGALSLSFENVSFGYSGSDPTIRQLSFRLEPGRVLGLLGRTGSGKTTMARLVFRLFEGGDGVIRLDDQDIRTLPLKTLRSHVAMVTQDVQLFAATLRDNLTFFDTSIADERLLEVIESLGLSDWFNRLPGGFDTRLQTGGKGLSAGEGQLLAFTRVFLKNPGLVILDEASSRLDPATERLVERAIDTLLSNRSAIIIAHRLGTLCRADDILILDNGCRVEYGKRTELLTDSESMFSRLNRTGLQTAMA